MKIGIIGAGNIGGSLGRVWGKRSHDIVFGVRDQAKTQPLVDEIGANARADTLPAAAQFGEIVVIALR